MLGGRATFVLWSLIKGNVRRVLLVVAVVLLAGCTGLAPTATPSDSGDGTDPTPEVEAEPTDNETDAPANETAADATDEQVGEPPDDGVTHEERSDPETDQLGWHDGYWYDDPVAVNTTNGLNETELDAVVARAIARVEVIRDLPFEEDVDVNVINRTEFVDQRSGSGGDATTDTARDRLEDEQFRATFLVGDQADAGERQAETEGETIGGFYSLTDGEIVIVTDSETPRVNVGVLAHELTHALQDQHFDLLGVMRANTQDREHARLGLVEGDAEAVRFAYEDRCGTVWACVSFTDSEGDPADSTDSDVHLGLHINSLFPYNDGVVFVQSLRDGDDWTAVNEAYEAPPNTSREIIYPAEYGDFEAEPVELPDRSTDAWEPLRPPGGPDQQSIGQAGMTAMLAHTLYDEFNTDAVITPDQLLNFETQTDLNETNPLNYDIDFTRGWTGDGLAVYEHEDGEETAHVWRSTWESDDDAETFVAGYEALLTHWGGTERDGVWELPAESPFTGAYHVTVENRTVTITNAPTADQLVAVNQGTN